MLHDVVQRKKFYTLVLQKCLTRSGNTILNYGIILVLAIPVYRGRMKYLNGENK